VSRVPACFVRGRERDLSGCLTIHPVPLPCSKTPAEPTSPHLWRTCRCCPRLFQTEGPSGFLISRLTTRLQHLLPTLHEQRCRCPCKARFRLAGCTFAGRGSNPLDRFERFRVTSVPLSRPSPDARKIENETFNVLKTDGYNLEHNFGHGKQNLAALLVTLNLLAFAFHTVCDQTQPLWQLARSKTSSRVQFFSRLATITIYLIFPSWDDLLQTLAFTKPPPRPP